MCTVTDRALLGALACFCSQVVAACQLLRTQSGRSPGAGNGTPLQYSWASPVAQTVMNPPAVQRPRFNPWVRKIGSGRSPGAGHGTPLQYSWASPVAQTVKNPPAMQRPRFNPWVRKIPWSREWQPTPVFFPGESPWTEEPGGPQSTGSQRVRHD